MSGPCLMGCASGWLVAALLLLALGRTWLRAARRGERAARALHELRGPLCAAGLAVHALARRGLPVGAIRAELDRARLGLADLEAAWAGERPATAREVVDLTAVTVRHAEAWRALAAAHGARLVLRPASGPALVLGDPLRLAGALANLVANGAEHGGERVELRVRTWAGRVQVEVRDEGPGLTAALADPRGGRPTSARRGHGLAIVREVADALGGTLLAAPGRPGCRMVLELPGLDPDAAPGARARRAAAPRSAPPARELPGPLTASSSGRAG